MQIGAVSLVRRTVTATLENLTDGIVAAVPRLVSAIVFLAVAYVGITLLLKGLAAALGRVYPVEQELVVNLLVIVVGLFLWFGVALALLKILGLDDIAASVGTAAGFIALGISYALSEMIEDTVAGVYLLRDPDFNPGDRVDTAGITGVVTSIELRKTRFRLENGDTTVLANRNVESKWTHLTSDEGTE